MTRFFMGIGLCSILSGCYFTQHHTPDALDTWKTNANHVEAVKQWQLDGRLSLRNRNEISTASFSWQQRGKDFTLEVIGPFGQGAMHMEKTKDRITVQHNGEIFELTYKRQIIAEMLGIPVDAESLQYWFRGIPNPQIDYIVQALDAKGFITNMQQSGWQIACTEHRMTAIGYLPQKIHMSNAHFSVKGLMTRWKILY